MSLCVTFTYPFTQVGTYLLTNITYCYINVINSSDLRPVPPPGDCLEALGGKALRAVQRDPPKVACRALQVQEYSLKCTERYCITSKSRRLVYKGLP